MRKWLAAAIVVGVMLAIPLGVIAATTQVGSKLERQRAVHPPGTRASRGAAKQARGHWIDDERELWRSGDAQCVMISCCSGAEACVCGTLSRAGSDPCSSAIDVKRT